MQGKLKLSGRVAKKSEDQVKMEKVLMQEMIENPDQKEREYQRAAPLPECVPIVLLSNVSRETFTSVNDSARPVIRRHAKSLAMAL